MSSEDKTDFQRYREMYQNRLHSLANSNRNTDSSDHLTPSTSSSVRMQQTNSGVAHVAFPSGGAPSFVTPLQNIIEKKSIGQTFKDVLAKHQLGQVPYQVKIESQRLKPVAMLEPVPTTSKKQEEYITTVYNIVPRDLNPTSQNAGLSGFASTVHNNEQKRIQTQPIISANRSELEGISYQKSHSNTYAKPLLNITKNNLHTVELPISAANTKESTSSQLNVAHGELTDYHRRFDKKIRTYPSGPTQQEIYRRIQERQERRQAPDPSIETFAQNGESVVVSKLRSNLMLSIVKPMITSPAPGHVYGAPDVNSTLFKNQSVQYSSNEKEHNEGRRVLNILKSVSGCLSEPPPAHSVSIETFNSSHKLVTTSAPTVASDAVRKKSQYIDQSEVLNLDTKPYTANYMDNVERPTSIKLVALPNERTSQQPVLNYNIKESNSLTPVQNVAIVSSAAAPLQSNIAASIYSPQASNNVTWEQLQKYNLQQLFAQVQAARQQILDLNNDSTTMLKTDQEEHQSHQTTGSQICANESPPSASVATITLRTETENIFPSIAINQAIANMTNKIDGLYEDIHTSKRKNTSKERDSSKKRKPKNDHPTEPFLQNGPCHQVASRLPRCRECGRSAAARSRNASLIFCRFIAFRKLKYNSTGQLEVYGFANPNLDPKEADTSLWSSNLQKVPADLSIEKSKFLLGQVGFKFCELFHQEKEAYFDHMSEDKTIAWKQAVQGVREMCDVCQTTLFNHHWVCSKCGFVVCIDCYKCRKNGIITLDSTTKDKDAHGWLLCTGTKEPHDQKCLMLTQIIPSNCLYKLVRQMHGICALLEIPLSCECPLSREPLLRNFKDQLEFIYPITVHGKETTDTQMVSVTIKSINQLDKINFDTLSDDNDPFKCQVEFSQQYHKSVHQHVEHSEDKTMDKTSTYSFQGFERDIHTDGDHFDESLYKISAKSKRDENMELDETMKQLLESKEMKSLVGKPDDDEKLNRILCENSQLVSNSNGDYPSKQNILEANRMEETNGTKHKILVENVETKNDILSNDSQKNHVIEPFKVDFVKHEAIIEDESMKREKNVNQNQSIGTLSTDSSMNGGKDQKPIEATSKVPVPVPYSEENRFKPSARIDEKTFAIIMKQVVKFDKTAIFQTLTPHLANEWGQLADFVECISIQRERVQRFVLYFLDEFIFLKGHNSNDDLTNEREIVEYNQSTNVGKMFRSKGERKMNLTESSSLYSDVAHEWLCNGKLLRLLDPLDVHNYSVFHDQWERGQPVMVSGVSSKMNMDLWIPQSFGRDFGDQVNDLINCLNGKIVRGHPMKVFWDGFETIGERLIDERERSMMLKLKDWPPGDDFAEMMPTRFYDLMKSLPLAEYTRREGRLNLASRLCSFFVKPDLGPKMYSAYGSALHPNKGTTNLHLDISDAVNVMVYVGVPSDVPRERYNDKIVELIDGEDCDYLTRQRIRKRKELPGALWHIYHAQDADKIRSLLNKIELERGGTIKPNHDPIHDQKWYLDRNMRKRLQQEYNVEGYAIVQCSGDAIFIPAGAPHQVRNLHNCIKVAEDFVSPENISHCLKLTNEFRHLSKTHSNHEDKLQIKNIIYHTVKDAISCITNPLIMMTNDTVERMKCNL